MEITSDNKPDYSGWHIALDRANPSDDRPYLGDPDAVSTLVRMAANAEISNLVSWGNDVITEAQAKASAMALCESLASTFMGQNEAYQPVGAWNTDGQLARLLGERYFIDAKDRTPQENLVAFFSLFMADIHKIIGPIAADDGDFDEALTSLNALVEDVTRALLGLPPDTGVLSEPED